MTSKRRRISAIWITAISLTSIAATDLALAQRGSAGNRQAAAPISSDRSGSDDQAIPSKLQPSFPDTMACPEIASPYGSRTRFDGSFRPPWAFGGHHGGIDISLTEGTPLLAIAAGTVAGVGVGGVMEGIYLWLRHSPTDTGLAYWVYSKYQHLQSRPELPVGTKVGVGQPVAHSGRTGTVGGHYGASGYPHLHLTTRKGSTGNEVVGSRESTNGMPLMDPLAVFHETLPGFVPAEDSAPKVESVVIPFVNTDGRLSPPDARVAWPVACQQK